MRDGLDEGGQADRLGQVGGDAEAAAFVDVLRIDGAGHDNDGHLTQPRVLPDFLEQLDATHAGQTQIEENRQGRGGVLEKVESVLAVANHGDAVLEMGTGQLARQQKAVVRVVLDHQDGGSVACLDHRFVPISD